jgi:hypothetical protein
MAQALILRNGLGRRIESAVLFHLSQGESHSGFMGCGRKAAIQMQALRWRYQLNLRFQLCPFCGSRRIVAKQELTKNWVYFLLVTRDRLSIGYCAG